MIKKGKTYVNESSGDFIFLIVSSLRILLLLFIVFSFIYGRNLVLIMSVFAFLFSLIPFVFNRFLNIEIPASFEMIVLFFIFGLFVFLESRGIFHEFWLVEAFFIFISSIILGFVGITLFYALEDKGIIDSNAFLLLFFGFTFSFCSRALWEVIEYLFDTLLGFGLQSGGLEDTMLDLLVSLVGALFVSELGFLEHIRGRRGFFSGSFFIFFSGLSIFKSQKKNISNKDYLRRIIDKGEGDFLEFKSSLRKNLFSGLIDKRIEHSVLKTICGYLNSRGGTLLVGVGDKGEILGLRDDEFASLDKLKLYFTSLIRNYFGNQFLAYVSFAIYSTEGKDVLKVDCSPAKKRVFLKWEGSEEFYVRHGASTVHLNGNALVDYVSNRFG